MYEYKVVDHIMTRYNGQVPLQDRINEFAQEGWRVSSLTTLSYNRIRTDDNHGHGVRIEASYHIVLERKIDPDREVIRESIEKIRDQLLIDIASEQACFDLFSNSTATREDMVEYHASLVAKTTETLLRLNLQLDKVEDALKSFK